MLSISFTFKLEYLKHLLRKPVRSTVQNRIEFAQHAERAFSLTLSKTDIMHGV